MSPVAAASRLTLPRLIIVLLFLLIPGMGYAQPPEEAPVVRISQVYSGGGINRTATYGCDFIELFNSSGAPVDLKGWSVQYHDGSWIPLKPGAIKIPASGYYLVAKQPCADNSRPPVPTPDFAPNNVSMPTGEGRVALVKNEERITGKDDPDVVDFVGYGSAVEYEGSGAAPASTANLSAHRKGGGCQDQDDNKADFEALVPLARNSSSEQHTCISEQAPAVSSLTPADGSEDVARNANFAVTFSEPVTLAQDWFRVECDLSADVTPASALVTGGPTSYTIDPNADLYGDDACSLTVYADQVSDEDTADPPDGLAGDYQAQFTTAAGTCGDPAYLIHDLQGAGEPSPANGQARTVEGVVVGDFQGADQLGGFFVEEEPGDQDTDAETSEGLFIRDGSPSLIDVSAGQRVRVTGRVSEEEGATALTSVTRVTDCGLAALPAPVTVSLPVLSLDAWEQVEGMRVTFGDTLMVTESEQLRASGRLTLVSGERPLAYTQLHAPDVAGYAAFRNDLSNRTIVLDDGSDAAYPDPIIYPAPELSANNPVRVGDRVAPDLTGVIDGRGYRLHPTTPPVFGGDNPRPTAPLRDEANARALFLSLDDYFTPDNGVYGTRGASNESELERQRGKLAAALAALDADIVAVGKLENDGTGVGSALADLVAALNAATQPGAYAAIESGETWGGGEATVGMIYRVERMTPVGRPAMLDSGAFAQTGGQPLHAAPMAQTFEEATWGERLTVVANQWRGRDACPPDGLDTDQGDGQDCWNASRSAAANELAAWLASDPTGAADSDILILGELNAFRLETPIQNLAAAGYSDLIQAFAGEQAVSLLWLGAAGYADHALASASLAPQATNAGTWRISAEEPSALDYQTENKSTEQLVSLYAADPYRASNRDPVVVDLSLLPDQSDLGGDYGLAWHTGQGAWRLGDAWGGADDGVVRGAGSWNDGQGEVTVSVDGPAGQHACLHAWLDYSDGQAQAGEPDAPNGQWDDNEKVIDGLVLAPGDDQPLTFPLPAGVIDGSKTYNMRFRLIPAPAPASSTCAPLATAAELAPIGRADGGEVEDWSFASGPLAVRITGFAARIQGETIVVTWETEEEIDAVGFDVFSAVDEDGPWQRVNAGLLPAKSPGATAGASYSYTYRGGQRARWHRLEALEASGARESFGPVLTERAEPTAIQLTASAATRTASVRETAAYFSCLAAAVVLWVCLRRRTR